MDWKATRSPSSNSRQSEDHEPQPAAIPSPQPKVTDPVGGEQPAVSADSATFPVDIVSGWTADRCTLTVAVMNPTDADQPPKLNLAGAPLTGKGTLWRLAPNGSDIQKPSITSSSVDSIPDSLTLPRYSINIYELAAKQ